MLSHLTRWFMAAVTSPAVYGFVGSWAQWVEVEVMEAGFPEPTPGWTTYFDTTFILQMR